MSQLHPLPELAVTVRKRLPADMPVHLVGGAVRDWLLQRPVVDMDFVLPRDAVSWARRVARDLNADFYVLDEARGVARVLVTTKEGRRILDFANYRAPTLEEDLRLRDFTINAMAIDPLRPQTLIDPLHGLQDLLDKRLRLCTPTALLDDPLRVLRAVRFALDLDLSLLPETRQAIREAVPYLNRVSAERIRDEFVRLVELPKFPAALRLLHRLEALERFLPEVACLDTVALPPGYADATVWHHTLHTLERLQDLLDALLPPYDPDKVANILLAQVSWKLGRYRHALDALLKEIRAGFRPVLVLFKLGVLFHDAGKGKVPPEHPDPEAHARAGRLLVKQRMEALHFARGEIRWLERFVAHHMWPRRYVQAGLPEPVDLHRFFRGTEETGFPIGLLHLADFWAKAGLKVDREAWAHQVDIVRRIGEAWWEHRDEWISPQPLLRGDEVIQALGRAPGPWVGALLQALQEAQVAGQVQTKAQALAWAQAWVAQQGALYAREASDNGT